MKVLGRWYNVDIQFKREELRNIRFIGSLSKNQNIEEILETVLKRILERKFIEKRADDNEDIVIKRFQTYEKSSEPVLNYYKQTKLLQVVNGENSITQINNEISGLIDSIKG